MQSTLALSYQALLAEVGDFLGHGRGEEFGERAWSDKEALSIKFCVESGLRQFYDPPPVEGTPSAYEWSFLRPVATLALAEGAQYVDLPSDFGGIEGQVTLLSSSLCSLAVKVTNDGYINRAYALTPSATGRPAMVAVTGLKDISSGQKKRLLVFPEADTDYTLQFAYYVLPDALTNPFPHPYGGAQHSETILESCLAIAEQRRDDEMGLHTAKFKERLLASISADRKSKAHTLGYNGDQSDGFHGYWRYWRQEGTTVTIGGLIPS